MSCTAVRSFFALALLVIAADGRQVFLVCSMVVPSNSANSSYSNFAEVLADQTITSVILTEDCRLDAKDFVSLPSKKISIERNLTITSAGAAKQLLELSFIKHAAVLRKGVVLTLRNLALGRVRKNSGWNVPFFGGEGVLLMRDVLRVRLYCQPNPNNNSMATASAIARPAAFPGRQLFKASSYDWRGKHYPDAFSMVDMVVFVGPGDTEDSHIYSGYYIWQLNSTRICLNFIPAMCTKTMELDDCILAAVDAMVNAEAAAAPSGQTHNVAAIAAAVAVAGCALIVGAVVFFMWTRRRQRQKLLLLLDQKPGEAQQHQQHKLDLLDQSELGHSFDRAAALAAASGAACRADVASKGSSEKAAVGVAFSSAAAGAGGRFSGSTGSPAAGAKAAAKFAMPDRMPSTFSGAAGSIEEVAVGGDNGGRAAGWQLMTYHTSPEFKNASPRDKIALGVLLGVGSFGRVYKGIWSGLDVAVKVLHHDSNTAAAVANEVDLVMSFRHTNITAAYHFVTWSNCSSATRENGGSGRHRSSRQQQQQLLAIAPASAGDDLAAGPGCSQVEADVRWLSVTGGGEAAGLSSGCILVGASGSCHSCPAQSAYQQELDPLEQPPPAEQQQRLLPQNRNGRLEADKQPGNDQIGVEEDQQQPRFIPCSPNMFQRQLPLLPQREEQQHQGQPQPEPVEELKYCQQQPQQQRCEEKTSDSASSPLLLASSQQQVSVELSALPSSSRNSQLPQTIWTTAGSNLASNSKSSSKVNHCNAGGWLRSSGNNLPPLEAQTWLILEYCDGGTLLDVLQQGHLLSRTTGRVDLAHVLTLLSDIAAGMSYLHCRNVLHGDLKPGNVMLKQQQGVPYNHIAKVTDFGMSRSLNVGQSHRSTRTLGTVSHMAPEQLRLGRLSPACDVYAFGIMMWELYTGRVAFQGMHYGQVLEQVALLQDRPAIPADMPEEYAALLTAAWAHDPFRRPSFAVIQQRLKSMLGGIVQEEGDAAARFVFDL